MGKEKQKKQEKRFIKACKILEQNDGVLVLDMSQSLFIELTMDYLARTLGDLHVEYLDIEKKWSVSTCYTDKGWEGWKHSKSLVSVLAKAVVALDKQFKYS